MKSTVISSTFARIFILVLLIATRVSAEDLSLVKTWEFGLGVGAVAGPDYRGSKENRSYFAPIPYIIYRGKFIQTDREGVRGQFLQSDRLELNLSLSANITPESYKNRLRASLGLPELGSTLEVGPALNINLTGASLRDGWLLSLPLRGVFAIGGDETGYIGYLVQPQLMYRQRWNALSFSYRTSVTYASEDYHSYYYGMNLEQATAEFPEYTAQAGYSGWANQASISHGFGDWRLGIFVRHDLLNNARFIDSPLVETRQSLRGGIALIWVMR